MLDGVFQQALLAIGAASHDDTDARVRVLATLAAQVHGLLPLILAPDPPAVPVPT